MSFDKRKARELIMRHGEEVLVSWAVLRYVADYPSSFITTESGMIHLCSALKVLGNIDVKNADSTHVRQETLTRHWIREREYPSHPEELATIFGQALANRGLGNVQGRFQQVFVQLASTLPALIDLAASGDSARIDEYVRELAEPTRGYSA